MKIFSRAILILFFSIVLVILGYFLVHIYIGREMREAQRDNFQKIKNEFYKAHFHAVVVNLLDDDCILINDLKKGLNEDLPSIFVNGNILNVSDTLYKKPNSFRLFKLEANKKKKEIDYVFCAER